MIRHAEMTAVFSARAAVFRSLQISVPFGNQKNFSMKITAPTKIYKNSSGVSFCYRNSNAFQKQFAKRHRFYAVTTLTRDAILRTLAS